MFVLKSIGDQHLRAVSVLPKPPVWRSAFFRRGGHYHPTDGEAQEITEAYKMEIINLQMRHSILMESLVA